MDGILRRWPIRYAGAREKPLADGSLTLFHPDTKEFITLSPLAAFLWESSTGHDTLAALVQEIRSVFPEQAGVERDVIDLVQALAAKRFITLSDTPEDGDAEQRAVAQSVDAANPFDLFDGIFCLNLDNESHRLREALRRYETLGIVGRVERFPAIPTPENHSRGCTMSWRAMIAEAARRDYRHMLGLEDDAIFLDDTPAVLRTATVELAHHEWDLFYLGACVRSREFPVVQGDPVLKACGPVTCTHALAVHRRAYARILTDIPPDGAAFDAWMAEHRAIDQYLSRMIGNGTLRAYITAPRVASRPPLLRYDDADRALASRYVI